MKNLKRALCLFLALVMCLSMLPMNVFAASIAEGAEAGVTEGTGNEPAPEGGEADEPEGATTPGDSENSEETGDSQDSEEVKNESEGNEGTEDPADNTVENEEPEDPTNTTADPEESKDPAEPEETEVEIPEDATEVTADKLTALPESQYGKAMSMDSFFGLIQSSNVVEKETKGFLGGLFGGGKEAVIPEKLTFVVDGEELVFEYAKAKSDEPYEEKVTVTEDAILLDDVKAAAVYAQGEAKGQDGISTLNDINQGEFKAITLAKGASYSPDVSGTWATYYNGESTDPSIVTVQNNRFTGVTAGTTKVWLRTGGMFGSTYTEYTVVVTENSGTDVQVAAFYYAVSTTANLDTNDTGAWGSTLGIGTIELNGVNFSGGNNCVIKDNPEHVTSWPAGYTGGKIERNDAGGHWDTIYNDYHNRLEEELGLQISEDDIISITLQPYKISKNDGNHHVDCKVVIEARDVATVTFYLKDANGNRFEQLDAWNVWTGDDPTSIDPSSRDKLSENMLPATKKIGTTTYVLSGWYTDESCTGTPVQFPTTVSSNTKYYAKYEPLVTYTVTYDLNSGNVDGNTQNVIHRNLESGSNTPEPPIPEKDGYTFVGWKSGNTVYANPKDEHPTPLPGTVTENVTYTAQWEQSTATVIYHANNGVTPEQTGNDTAPVGEYAVKANDGEGGIGFTKADYDFAGWMLTENGSGVVTTLTIEAGQEYHLYAKWVETKPVISTDPTDPTRKDITKTAQVYGSNGKLTEATSVEVGQLVTYTVTVNPDPNGGLVKTVTITDPMLDVASITAVKVGTSTLGSNGYTAMTENGVTTITLTTATRAAISVTYTHEITADDVDVDVNDPENPVVSNTAEVTVANGGGQDGGEATKDLPVVEPNVSVKKFISKVGDRAFTETRQPGAGFKAYVGETIEWTIEVTNNGEAVATGVEVTEEFTVNDQPRTLTSLTLNGKNVELVDGKIPVGTVYPGQTKTYKAAYTVQSGDTTISNGASIEGEQPDPPVIEVDTKDAVSVAKSVAINGVAVTGGAKAKVGDVLTYTIRVTNNGNVAYTAEKPLVITDTLTAGNEARVPDSYGQSTAYDVTEATQENPVSTFTIKSLRENDGTLPHFLEITYTYTVQAEDAGKTLNNTAIASDVPGTPKGEQSVEVDKLISSVTKTLVTENSDGSAAGQNVTLADDGKLVVENAGQPITLIYRFTVEGDAGASFTIKDKGAALVEGSVSEGGTVTAEDGVFTGTVGESGTVTFDVTMEFPYIEGTGYGELTNRATVENAPDDIPDPTPEAKSFTVKVQYVADDGNALGKDPYTEIVKENDSYNVSGEAIIFPSIDVGEGENAKHYVLDTVDGATSGNATSNVTITATYSVDEKGNPKDPTKPDGTPDKYQATVTYKVVNGYWSKNGETVDKADKTVVVTLSEKDADTGEWTPIDQKDLERQIPTEMTPNKGYKGEGAKWDKDPANVELKGDREYTFTYSFVKDDSTKHAVTVLVKYYKMTIAGDVTGLEPVQTDRAAAETWIGEKVSTHVAIEPRQDQFKGYRYYGFIDRSAKYPTMDTTSELNPTYNKALDVGEASAEYVLEVYYAPALQVTEVTKELVTNKADAEGVAIPENVEIDYPVDGVITPKDDSVTLLYKITITGEVGANYILTDAGATLIGAAGNEVDKIEGKIADANGDTYYAYKTFDASESGSFGALSNKATVDAGGNTVVNPADPEATVYTVTYRYNGEVPAGATELPKTVIVAADTQVTASAVTAPAGYTFNGWSSTGLIINEDGTFTMPAHNVVLTGTFTAGSVTITYQTEDENKGTVSRTADTLNPATGTPAGSTAIAKPGYVFVNWTKGDDVVSSNATFVPTKVEGKYVEATYTAHFAQYRTVTYTDGVDGTVFAAQVNRNLLDGSATPEFVGTPNRAGYTFTGWTPEVVDTVNGDATYTATWTANEAKIVFVTNGGNTVEDMTGETDEEITRAMPVPTREGYTFNGWFDIADNEIKTLPEKFPAGTTVYYARWTEKDKVAIDYVAVAVDGNVAGTVSKTSESLNPTTGVANGSTAVANKGYKFVGWFATAEAEEGEKALSTKVTYVPTKSEANWTEATYYARFAKDDSQTKTLTYTVEYYRGEDQVEADTQTETKTVQWLETDETMTVATTKINTNNKYFGYKLDKITVNGTPVDPAKTLPETVTSGDTIKVYYVTDDGQTKTLTYTVEYYKDNEKVEADTVTKTKDVQVLSGGFITVDQGLYTNGNKYPGYELKKVENGPDTNGQVVSGTVIKVKYTQNADVTINYVSANTDMGTVSPGKETLAPATDEAQGSTATAIEGYRFQYWTKAVDGAEDPIVSYDPHFVPEKVGGVNVPATYTAHFEVNSDKTKTLSYTVKYFKGDTWVESDNQTVSVTIPAVDNTTTLTVDMDKINVTDKYYGYKYTHTVPAEIPTTVNKEGVMIEVHYVADPAKIVFVTNGGSAVNDLVGKTDGPVDGSLPTNTDTTRSGYTLEGWYSDQGLTHKVKDLPEKFPAGTTTYFAKWTEDAPVTINYVVADGSTGMGTVTPDKNENLAPASGNAAGSTATASDGYKFLNWTNADGNVVSKNETFVPGRNANGLYEAATYTAHFFPDRNNNNVDDRTELRTVTYTDGVDGSVFAAQKTENLLDGDDTPKFKVNGVEADPTRNGYVFVCWSPDVNPTVDGNATYTAIWSEQASVTISYEATTGGTVSSASESLNPVLDETAQGSTAIAEPGYKFVNWTDAEGKVVGTSAKFAPTKEEGTDWTGATYTAHFTKNEYTITYDLDGGTVAEGNPATYTVTDVVKVEKQPTKAGYEFLGWTGSNGDEPQATVTMPERTTGNLTFKANWKEVTNVTITYEATKGGSVDSTSESLAPATGEAKGSTATANKGYKFVNWTRMVDDPENRGEKKAVEVSKDLHFTPDKVNGLNVAETYTANFVADDDQTKPLHYTVVYYKNGLIDEKSMETVKKDVQVLQSDTMEVDTSKINTANKFGTGFALDKVVVGDTEVATDEIPTSVENGTVIRVYYATDEVGNTDDPTTPNNVPDKYELKVTFQVKNGAWSENDAADKVIYLPKYDGEKLAENGTATLDANSFWADPTVPNDRFQNTGAWTKGGESMSRPEGENELTLTEDTVYVFTFTAKGELTITADPYVNVYDGGSHNPIKALTIKDKDGNVLYALNPENPADPEDAKLSITYTYKVEGEDGETDTVTVRSINDLADIKNVGDTPKPVEITVTYEGYNPQTVTVEAKITPKTLTVTTESASKTHNGTALTAPGSISGLVGDETVTFTVTGSQTEINKSTNTYKLDWDGTAKESNYVIVEKLGTLIVIPSDGSTIIVRPDPNPNPGGGGVDIEDEDPPLANVDGNLNTTDHFAYIIGRGENCVQPLENITRAEVATIFFRLLTEDFRVANWSTVSSFPDVEAGAWYATEIATAERAGILKGCDDGNMQPDRDITRAEFTVMAIRFLNGSIADDGTGDFADTANHWAAKEIRLAAKAGWIKGYGNNFRPNDPITRAEAMTIINRMLDRVPGDTFPAGTIEWGDNPKDAWYYADVMEATNGHDYEREEGSVVEKWTAITPYRDWIALEAEWTANNGASAPASEEK